MEFQYILCYGSTLTFADALRTKTISIHPMLRFNPSNLLILEGFFCISIHPMLRFNYVPIGFLFTRKAISIHPMLRFNVLLKI